MCDINLYIKYTSAHEHSAIYIALRCFHRFHGEVIDHGIYPDIYQTSRVLDIMISLLHLHFNTCNFIVTLE